MMAKIEELFENEFIVKVLSGIVVSLATMCMMFTIVTVILCFTHSPWWSLATFACTIATGALFGAYAYLIDT